MIAAEQGAQPGLSPAERGLAIAAVSVVTGRLVLGGLGEAYRRTRLGRYSPEQFEAATAPSSILPYIEYALEEANNMGLEVVLAGGIAKKALSDPETVFNQGEKTIRVSDNQSCVSRKNATVLRPDEITERDIDLFCKYIWVGEGAARCRVVADQSKPEVAALIKAKAKELQNKIDEKAKQSGLDLGPELSLFAYDEPYGHDFRLTDYATKTDLSACGKSEILYDNSGNRFEMPVDDQWVLLVGGLRIPVNSPQVQLGRTLNRTKVPRERDVADVNAAIRNLKAKGLWQGELTDIWYLHQQFRHAMNDSIRPSRIVRTSKMSTMVHLVGLRTLAPLSGVVEESPLLCPAIRDRRGPLSKIAGWVMNASSGK